MPIGFNRPYLTGNELAYIEDVFELRQLSGNGKYTKLCQEYFQKKYDFKKCLLTTSCTDALEMAAILLDIQQGDEIIMPSFTFVSTANAFVLRGAKIVFADSMNDNPNIDVAKIDSLITSKTKAIVPVHYAGVACDMDAITDIANKYGLYVVEDAAQAIDNFYINCKGEKKPLGSIGNLATFSFHETKNIISGEGGMLVVNDRQFAERAEIIWEKGTNRSAFFRGEVDKYSWVDIGSSFLPSEIISAFLFAQVRSIDVIQAKRKEIWNWYYEGLRHLNNVGRIKLPVLPDYSTNNAHMFYIVCASIQERSELIGFLKKHEIITVFHYLSLHKSVLNQKYSIPPHLPNSDRFSNCLLRLPFYYELSKDEVAHICKLISNFYTDSFATCVVLS